MTKEYENKCFTLLSFMAIHYIYGKIHKNISKYKIHIKAMIIIWRHYTQALVEIFIKVLNFYHRSYFSERLKVKSLTALECYGRLKEQQYT